MDNSIRLTPAEQLAKAANINHIPSIIEQERAAHLGKVLTLGPVRAEQLEEEEDE